MQDMTKHRLPYLNRSVNRVGAVYWYVRRRHGARIPVPGEYGSKEFLDAYHDAVAGIATARPETRASKGTLLWLVNAWKLSSDWAQTSPATRKQRDNILARVLEDNGGCAIEDIDAAAIRAGRERRQATPAAANNFLKTMRALFRWAREVPLVDIDPAKDVKFIKVKTKGFTPWTLEDVAAYRARWPLGTRERLALEILINTGFRRGDVVRVGRQHVQDKVIHIAAGKNGVKLYIPILPALADALAAGPVGDMSFLASQYGRPLKKESFGNIFKGWCRAAGIKAKSAHGIRKLAATMVADNGGSEQQLQALFGWTTNTMSAIYTREANRQRQALQAAYRLMEELERNGTENALSLPNTEGEAPNTNKKLR